MTLSAQDLRSRVMHSATLNDLQHESRKVFQIMAEFVEGFDMMTDPHPAVSFFDSSRARHSHPHYRFARKTAKLFSEAGFSIVSGGGPGIMEALNRGAQEGGWPTLG